MRRQAGGKHICTDCGSLQLRKRWFGQCSAGTRPPNQTSQRQHAATSSCCNGVTYRLHPRIPRTPDSFRRLMSVGICMAFCWLWAQAPLFTKLRSLRLKAAALGASALRRGLSCS